MKKILFIAAICIISGCAGTMNNAQQGAVLGGLTGMAVTALSKGDREAALWSGAGGAVVGYIIGNEIDKSQRPPTYAQPMPNQQRKCQKVREWKNINGQVVETITEKCTSDRYEPGVY